MLRSFRSGGISLAIMLLVMLLAAAPAALRPQTASAQSPFGYGQFCQGFSVGVACNGPSSVTFTCPDGTSIYAGQACPSPVSVATTQVCPYFAVSPSCPRLPSTFVLPAISRIVSLPSYQYVLITNSWSTTASVSGADMVLVYDWTSRNYYETSTLAPGQSAWAFSYSGGQAMLTAFGS